jgi:hypothetical protein
MNKFIRRTLVAAAIITSSGTAVAGTLSVTLQTHSLEGVANLTTKQASESISYTLGAAYATGDTVTFRFNGDVITNTVFPSQINVAAVDSATQSDAVAGLALGLLNTDETSVSYRVTSVTQPDDTPGDGGTSYTDRTTLGATAVLGSVSYTYDSLSSSDLNMTTFSNTSNGGALDTNASGTLATTKSQFGTAAMNTMFDNVIDVSTARKTFVGTTTDTMSWTITNPVTTGWLNLATINASSGTVVTVKGGAGKLSGLASSNFTVAGGGTATYSAESDQAVLAYSGSVNSDTLTFTAPTDSDSAVLNTQSFTTSVMYNYTTVAGAAGSMTVGNNLSAGSWSLNGAVITIPYMPYSSNASQIIYLTNTGTQTGNILVTAFDLDGNSYDLGVVASSKGGQLTKLATVIKSSLEAKGFSAGKLTITVTVEVPKANIIVYASYNVGGSDRGFVNTDQYLPVQ